MNLLDVFNPIIKLVTKAVPDADKKLEILLAIEQARTGLKQPLALSIIAILFSLNYIVKSIIYKLKLLVYFNTPEWYTDVVFVAVIFSFMFGVPFKDVIGVIRNYIKEKRGK